MHVIAFSLAQLRDDSTSECVNALPNGHLALDTIDSQATTQTIIDAVRSNLGDPTLWCGKSGYVKFDSFKKTLKQVGTLSPGKRGSYIELQLNQPATVYTLVKVEDNVAPDVGFCQATRATLQRAEAQAQAEAPPQCFICFDGDTSEQPLLSTGCACAREGSSVGVAHVHCFVSAAQRNEDLWHVCPTCKQWFTGEMLTGLARARWELVRDRAKADPERLYAAKHLATVLLQDVYDGTGSCRLSKWLFEEHVGVPRQTREGHWVHVLTISDT